MPGPRFRPTDPPPLPQAGLPAASPTLVPAAPQQELAAISSLNANISVASATSGWAYTASGIAYRCGAVTFTVTAGIAVGGALFVVTFQHPFRGAPIVLCGGGPALIAALLASGISATQFQVFTATALAAGAGQVMQWIAVGV